MQDFVHSIHERIANFMYRVYGLMAVAFVITATTAYYIANTESLFKPLVEKPALFIGVMIVQLILVVVLTLMMTRLSFFMAATLFFVYSLSMGVTISVIFLVFQLSSIYIAFFVSALMFAAMSIYGYFTGTDLTSIGNIVMMALLGLIIGLFVNLFLKNSMVDIILSAVGVIIFTALTAYDTQRLKYMARLMFSEGVEIRQVAVFGALTLYLDFVNLFLFMLQLTGRRRD